MRECLYWRDCPESVLKELLSLTKGLDDRSVALRTVRAESEQFAVFEYAKINSAGDPDLTQVENLTASDAKKELLFKKILQ